MKPPIDRAIYEKLNDGLQKLEEHYQADFLVYYGSIAERDVPDYKDLISELKRIVEKMPCL